MSMALAVFIDGPNAGEERWLPTDPPAREVVTMTFTEGPSPTISGIHHRFMYVRQSDQPNADGKWEYQLKGSNP